MNGDKGINIEVESISQDLPRQMVCEKCGSREDLRSICGFLICGECLQGDF